MNKCDKVPTHLDMNINLLIAEPLIYLQDLKSFPTRVARYGMPCMCFKIFY